MKPKKKDYPFRWIDIALLSVAWIEAQSPYNETNIKHGVAHFDFDALGVLIVTDILPDGTHHIIDGKHRKEMLARLFGAEPGAVQAPCLVITGVTDPQRAAEIWLKMDKRSNPTAIQRFRLCLTAQEPEAIAIQRIIASAGYRIASDKCEGAFAAIMAARAIYRRYGGDGLLMAVVAVKAAYGLNPAAVEAPIVQGMALFLHLYGKEIDRERLIRMLSKRGAPAILIGDARTLKATNGRPMAENVTECIRATYNSGRRTHRLAASE